MKEEVLGLSPASHELLLWFCVLAGLAICVAIVGVTIRHHRRRRRGADPDAGSARSSLLSEVGWVLIPVLMMVLLGAWIVAERWPGHGDAVSAGQFRSTPVAVPPGQGPA